MPIAQTRAVHDISEEQDCKSRSTQVLGEAHEQESEVGASSKAERECTLTPISLLPLGPKTAFACVRVGVCS